MLLVLAMCLWTVAISNAPLLSSNALYINLGIVDSMGNPAFLRSFRSFIIGISSLSTYDIPVYYDSVLDSMISVFNWYFHTKGHLSYIIMHPCLDSAVSLYNDSYLSQLPENLASTYTSRSFPVSGINSVPLSPFLF